MAHGFLLFLIGIALVYTEPFLKTTALSGIASAWYLILLMGFFATFCGLLYNDFASLPIEIFGGSCYTDASP